MFRASQVCRSAVNPATRLSTIGWIGLGAMGNPMISNLVNKTLTASSPRTSGSSEPDPIKSVESTPRPKVRFVVHDANERVESRQAPLKKSVSLKERAGGQAVTRFITTHTSAFPGAEIIPVSTPAAVARASSNIVTMLPSSEHVQEVYLNPETGILEGLLEIKSQDRKSETLCIDCTTLDQAVAKDVAATVKSKTEGDANMIDAPVSGGVVGATAGTLAFMCGGDTDAFERARPLLELMGKRIVYCGESGNGLIAKICNNMLLGITMIGTAEAMLLGARLGMAPELLASIINSSSGKNWSSEINNPAPGAIPGKSLPADRDYEGGFLSKLMSKDLGLAKSACESSDPKLALPLSTVATKIYSKLAEAPEFSDRDFSSVYRWLEIANSKLPES